MKKKYLFFIIFMIFYGCQNNNEITTCNVSVTNNIGYVDGKVYSGRVTNDVDGELTVSIDAVDPTKTVVIKKSNVDEMEPAKVSLMPAKLLNELNQDEVLDLLAYMLSRGNPQSNMFINIESE